MDKGIAESAEELNRVLMTFPWIDFEVWEYIGDRLTICGSISTSYPGDIYIYFHDPFYVSLPFSWRTSTSRDVFSLLTGDEACALNFRFGVEVGYHHFRFQPEDLPAGVTCDIGAKSFSWEIRKGNAG